MCLTPAVAVVETDKKKERKEKTTTAVIEVHDNAHLTLIEPAHEHQQQAVPTIGAHDGVRERVYSFSAAA